MWQATGIKLGAQQQELEVVLAEAMQRLEVEFQGMQHPSMALFCCMPACGMGMPPTLHRAVKAAKLLHSHCRTVLQNVCAASTPAASSLCTMFGIQAPAMCSLQGLQQVTHRVWSTTLCIV